MTSAYRLTTKAVLILFAAMTVLFMASACVRSQAHANPETPAEKFLVVKGKIKEISYADKTFVVKPNKGPTVQIIFTDRTTFVGFSSMEEITRKQPVQVWYFTNGESNLAVKIEKMPELGC